MSPACRRPFDTGPTLELRSAVILSELEGCEIPNFPVGKRSGRTETLIAMLVDDLKLGLPHAVVIGPTLDHSIGHLLPMVMEALLATGIEPVRRKRSVIDWNGSRIDFESVSEQGRRSAGRRAGEYWDHYAVGED